MVRQAYSNAAIRSVTNIVSTTRSSMFQPMLRFNKIAKMIAHITAPTAATPTLIRRNQYDFEPGDSEPPSAACERSASTPNAAITANPKWNSSVAMAGTRAFSTNGTTA